MSRSIAETERSATYRTRMMERRRDLALQLAAIFSRPHPFTWEVGCGHGHFLTAYATANPDKLCVGVDIVSERIARAQKKRDRAKLENLFFVHADAALFLDLLPAGVVCSELFVLFPDPWPKLRHHKHRILRPDFLTHSANRAAAECRLCFRTDYSPYFTDARRAIESHPDWLVTEDPWPFEFTTVFQSRAPTYSSLVARRRAHFRAQS
jgi:tRNA (guanine-N7-)-methyltransferase